VDDPSNNPKMHHKVGDFEMEQTLRTAPINGCEMESRWL